MNRFQEAFIKVAFGGTSPVNMNKPIPADGGGSARSGGGLQYAYARQGQGLMRSLLAPQPGAARMSYVINDSASRLARSAQKEPVVGYALQRSNQNMQKAVDGYVRTVTGAGK